MPIASITSFIVVCPFASIVDELGWDPRVPWAAALAFYGACRWWRTGRTSIPPKAGLYWSLFLAFCVLGLLLFTSGIPQADLYGSWTALMYVTVGGFVFYALAQLSDPPTHIRKMVFAFALSVLVVGASVAVSGLQSFRSGDVVRIAGPLRNANATAAFLALSTVVLLIFIRAGWLPLKFGVLAAAASALGCLSTLSRMGAVALVAGCVSAWVVRPKEKLFSYRMLTVVGLASLLAVLATVSYLLEYRLNSSNDNSNSGAARIMQAEQALDDLSRWEGVRYSTELWLQNPVFGVGLSVFPFYNYKKNGIYLGTHNTITEILVGTGAIGFLLLAAVLRRLLLSISMERRRLLAPAALVLGICLLFGEMLEAPEIFMAFGVLYWTILWTSADQFDPRKTQPRTMVQP
jgi:O-antigen ligase